MAERKATVTRDTLETQITVSVNLDGTGTAVKFDTGIPFWSTCWTRLPVTA